MFDCLMSTRPARDRSLKRRGLTPNDARALTSLERVHGRPIGALARDWACDPSNATFIVGRLERAGLVERRVSTHDRRVKLVALTPRGASIKEALLTEFRSASRDLLALDRADLKALERILKKLSRVTAATSPFFISP
jgi:DNA-binding MarR family transcriptional regulator